MRYYLNGLLLEVDSGHVRAVATDGHRLAMAHCDLQTGCPDLRQVIVPRKGVLELARLLDDDESPVTLVIGDNHLWATVGAYTFTSKLIEGKFPDYNRVIPRGGDKIVLADRATLKYPATGRYFVPRKHSRRTPEPVRDGCGYLPTTRTRNRPKMHCR